MGYGDLSDAERQLVGSLLPSERGRWARPAGDNRRFLNGMLHVLRVGYSRRDMHERYGKWNSVYVRFRRRAEQGVWDALLQTLVALGLTDDWRHMIDSATARGRVPAVGGKGALAQAFGRSRGGFTSKVHARCDNQGLPIGFILTGGEASDYAAVDNLMGLPLPKPKALLADKGYDGDRFRENLHPDYRRYKDRNRIVRMFGKLKQQRRISTRYDKTLFSFESFLNLAAARLWLRRCLHLA